MSSDAKLQAQHKHCISKSVRSLLTILKLSLLILKIENLKQMLLDTELQVQHKDGVLKLV